MSLNTYDKDLKQKILVDGTDEVDSALSTTSTNPVQNKVITEGLNTALASKASFLNIVLSGTAATLESDLNSKWSSLSGGMHVVRISNQSTIYHGTMFKYSDTIGSILFADAEGTQFIFNKQVGLTSPVLYFTGVACSATTGNFTNYSNTMITANHVVSECVFANPSAITTDVTWTTSNGNVTLNGTCTTATTVNLVLVKKGN